MAFQNVATEVQPRRWLARLYVLFWVALAGLALTYLAALALRPDLVAAYLPTPAQSKPQSNEGQRATARLVAEVQSLRQTLAEVQRDVAAVKTAVVANESADKALARRLTELEERLLSQPPTAALEAAPAPAPAAPPTAAADPRAEAAAKKAAVRSAAAVKAKELAAQRTAQPVPVSQSPISAADAAGALRLDTPATPAQPVAPSSGSPAVAAAPTAPRIINAGAPATAAAARASSIETASLPPPQSFTTTTTRDQTSEASAVGGGPAAIQLSSGPSVDALRLSWSLLNERHRTTLQRLEPRYQAAASGDQRSFQLIAGPLASTEEAGRVCSELRAKGVPCRVGNFRGDAL